MNNSNNHLRCLTVVAKVCERDTAIQHMLSVMSTLGCAIDPETNIVCEPCFIDSPVCGGFDPVSKEIIVCENKIESTKAASKLLFHELLHAYDHCRARVDWENTSHLACSEVRASNLCGECSVTPGRLFSHKFRQSHQRCVRSNAIQSLMCSRGLTRPEAEGAVDSVWNSCFYDFKPFHRIPREKKDFKFDSWKPP